MIRLYLYMYFDNVYRTCLSSFLCTGNFIFINWSYHKLFSFSTRSTKCGFPIIVIHSSIVWIDEYTRATAYTLLSFMWDGYFFYSHDIVDCCKLVRDLIMENLSCCLTRSGTFIVSFCPFMACSTLCPST